MKNSTDVKVMLKEAGILFAITLIAGLVLGFVYELTKEPIRLQQEKAIQEACAKVFVGASSFEAMEYTVPEGEMTAELSGMGVKIGRVYEAKGTAGERLGYVIETTSSEGYGGNIVLYVGVTLDGMVNDVSILTIAETPGLGMKAEDELVPQFHQKPAGTFSVTKSGSVSEMEIDAISGATVTTDAFTNAVNGAIRVYENLMQGGGSNE